MAVFSSGHRTTLLVAGLLLAGCATGGVVSSPAPSPTPPISASATTVPAASAPTPGPGAVILPSITWERVCDGLRADTCLGFVTTAEANLQGGSPVPRSIMARCTVASCTEDGGTGVTTVTYVDGTMNDSTWSYSRNPPTGAASVEWGRIVLPPPTWERWCEGMIELSCRERMADAEVGLAASLRLLGVDSAVVRALVVRCAVELCPDQAGPVETVAFFADGTSRLLFTVEGTVVTPPRPGPTATP